VQTSTYVMSMLNTFLLLLACGSIAVGKYVEPLSFTEPNKTVTLGSDGYSTSRWNDTGVFQRAIDDVAAAGGGHVVVPADTYRVKEVWLKSEVHIVFMGASSVYAHTAEVASWEHVNMFNVNSFGASAGPIENTSIRTVGGRTEIIFGDHINMRAFLYVNARNFLLSNFIIKDTKTLFPSAEFSWQAGRNPDGSQRVPTHGTVEHLRTDDAEFGYGTIQTQAGTDIYFHDIECEGGVTLRLETDWKLMMLAKEGGVRDIVANTIKNVNGRSGALGAHVVAARDKQRRRHRYQHHRCWQPVYGGARGLLAAQV